MGKGIVMAYKLKESVPNNTDESLPGLALRTGLRTAARIGETVVGLPGDIAQVGLGAANYISGGRVPTYEQVQEKLPISLPTSKNVKEFHEKATGEYLKPQNAAEELGDEFTGLVTALISPAKGIGGLTSAAKIGQSLSKVPKAAKVAGAALGGAQAVKALGGSEFAQEGTKLGIMLASGLPGGRKALAQKAEEAYGVVNSIPDTVTHKVPGLESSVKRLQKYTEVGHLTEDKKAIQEFIGSIEKSLEKGTTRTFKRHPNAEAIDLPSKISKKALESGEVIINKAIPVKELVQLEKDANQLLRDYKFPKQAKPYLADLRKEFETTLTEYGQTNKPWLEAYEESKDIYRGLHSRSKINQFLDDHTSIQGLFSSGFTKSLLFGGSLYAPAKTAGLVGGGIAAKQAIKSVELLKNSKSARKYYADALKAALDDNKHAFTQSAKKLDHAAVKFEEKNPIQGKWKLKS